MKIKNFRYLLYQLTPKANLNMVSSDKSRAGALLRFDFGSDGVGFADCHPWIQFGDQPLSEQLNLLAQNKLTSLTEKSLYFAKIDAQYRLQKQNVFYEKVLPQNHLITFYESLSDNDIVRISTEGFKFIKLKFGKNSAAEIEFIKNKYSLLKDKQIKLRLDFNCSLSFAQAESFFSAITKQIDILDFVEDPFEYNAQHWQKIQEKYGVSLALDKKALSSPGLTGGSTGFNVIIIKPAIENINDYLNEVTKKRIVFTSYMDHPLGQLCAMSEAIRFYEKFPHKREHCGFLTHSLYISNPDSGLLKIEKTMLIPPVAFGFGFGF